MSSDGINFLRGDHRGALTAKARRTQSAAAIFQKQRTQNELVRTHLRRAHKGLVLQERARIGIDFGYGCYQKQFLNMMYCNNTIMSSVIETSGEHKAQWVTISSDEYESMKSTLEVLSDSELMEQIKESKEDYKSGKFKNLRELMKE